MFRVIPGDLPDHHATQAVLAGISRFEADGLRIVVGDKMVLAWIEQPGHLGHILPIALVGGQEIVLDFAIIVGAFAEGARVRLKQPVVLCSDPCPSAPVKGDAQQQLGGGNPARQVGLQADVGAELLGIVARDIQGSVKAGNLDPGPVIIVGHHIDPVHQGRDRRQVVGA